MVEREVGDIIAKSILGEVETARILKVCGNEERRYYYTDQGIYWNENEIAETVEKAEEAARAWKGDRIWPCNLQKRHTWSYIRKYDKRKMWSQIGIYKGMLFWKDDMTYQFLEKVDDLVKAYKKKLKELSERAELCKASEIVEEHPMECLYYFRNNNRGEGYATAEYAACKY